MEATPLEQLPGRQPANVVLGRVHAEERKGADEGVRWIGVVQGWSPGLLAQFHSLQIANDGYVEMPRRPVRRGAEQRVQVDLAGSGIEQIVAADDVRDLLGGVVDDHRQLIGENAVGAQDNEVAAGCGELVVKRTQQAVLEVDREVFGDAEAPGPGGFAGRQAVAAGPGIKTSDARAGTGVDVIGEAGESFLVEPGTGALIDYLAVPFEGMGFEGTQDRVGGAGDGPRRVDILDPYEPLAAGGFGVEVAGHSRDQGSKM